MSKNITELGQREAEFLSEMASAKRRCFTMENALQFWGSPERARKKLYELERKGWITRIERGKYLIVPLEAGPAREWSEDTALIASILVEPAAIAYWSALRHWNWTEQIPRIVYIQTTTRKFSKTRRIAGVEYEIVKVPQDKFFGNVKEWIAGTPVLFTDKEKTLVDCASDPRRGGSIEELVKAVKEGAKEMSWNRLSEYIERYPNGAAKKRLGFLFETVVPNLSQEGRSALSAWKNNLSSGIVPLIPSKKREGKIVKRWGIIINARI